MTARAVDRARNDERSLVRTWAMRGTIHLLAADDVGWLVPLFTDQMNANSRKRLPELGMEAGTLRRALGLVGRWLAADGPLSRDELTGRLAANGVGLDVGARMHLFRYAVTSGVAVLGPDDESGRSCLVRTEDWLGKSQAFNRDASLRELARRYLGAFGPATDVDFAGWSGLPLRDVRAGLNGIADELAEDELGGGRAWRLRKRARSYRGSVARLLPGWDTYLMGYRDRDFIAAGDDWKRINAGGGMVKPCVVVDGVAVGVWRVERKKSSIRIRIETFSADGFAVRDRLLAEAEDVGRFEGREASLDLV